MGEYSTIIVSRSEGPLFRKDLYKSRSLCSSTGPLLTVFVSRLEVRASTPLYRFSLNASSPAPWTAPRPDNGEVSSFQVRGVSSGENTT